MHTYIHIYIHRGIYTYIVKPVYRFLGIQAKTLKPVYWFLGSTGLIAETTAATLKTAIMLRTLDGKES